MKKLTLASRSSRIAVALTLSLAIGSAASLALAQPKPGGAPPAPAAAGPTKVLVIDRNAILLASKVGQDIVRQVNGYRQTAEKEFRAEGESLQKEGQALRQQIAILAPDGIPIWVGAKRSIRASNSCGTIFRTIAGISSCCR